MYKEKSSGSNSETLFALIPAGVCVFALVLYLSVVLGGGFDDAFEGMRPPEKGQDAEEAAQLLAQEASGGTGETPKEDGDLRWFEGTLGICVGVMMLTWGTTAGFSPFTQIVGTMAYTHVLMLLRFVAEFSGRLFSHAWGVQYFNWGNTALLVLTSLRTFLLTGLIVEAFSLNFNLERNKWIFGVQVFFFFSLGSYVHSETMAAAVDSQPKHSQKIAYVMMLLCFASQLVALAAVVPLLKGLDVA
jgi:hypothetical protein